MRIRYTTTITIIGIDNYNINKRPLLIDDQGIMRPRHILDNQDLIRRNIFKTRSLRLNNKEKEKIENDTRILKIEVEDLVEALSA